MENQLFYSKVQFASLVKQGSGRSKSSHEKGVADKLASSIAILASVDRSAVAAAVVLEPRGAVVYLARNGGWNRPTMDYVNRVRSLLLGIGERSSEGAVHGNMKEVRDLKSLVEEHCGGKYHRKLGRLRERMNSDGPSDVVGALGGYQRFRRRIEEAGSIWEASLVCDQFYREFKRANPDTETTTVLKISRMATLFFALNTAVNCASRAEHRSAFTSSRFEYLEPQQTTYALMHWAEVLPEYAPEADDRRRLACHYEQDAAFQRESRGIYSSGRGSSQRVTMHAEMAVVSRVLSSLHGPRVFIGTSKSCCALCYHFIRELQIMGGNVHVRSTHGKLYPGWMIPELGQVGWNARVRRLMGEYVDAWVREGLGSVRLSLLPPDSDSHSANSSDVNLVVTDEELGDSLLAQLEQLTFADETDPI